VPLLREYGVKVLHKSATIRHALKAQAAGVDLIEIVGYEASIAGGQPGDEVGTWVILAKAASILTTPLIASGASATGRQLAAALAMGAHGITMATRFLATVEAPIDQKIKDHMALEETDERCTVIAMSSFSNSTRVFKNKVSLAMADMEKEAAAGKEVDFNALAPMASGQRTKAMWQQTGDWDDAMWSCSQSVGLINDVPTCSELLVRIAAEAEEQLTKASKAVVSRL
jgi:NAD(P)H-dependent flavin oxidoreductase YrpB (nitropropane dioxygenase family)